MASFFTPLRYPGGKGRLGQWLAELMRHNKISGGWYIEPYAGGAGAAIFLLLKGYVNHIVINDADPAIYAFWKAVIDDNKRLVQLIKDTPVTIENWYRQREVIASPSNYEPIEVGFATFFLNRTNRSGILSGGVIGGKNQDGPYALNARFNKEELCARIEKLGTMRTSIDVYGLDAMDLVNTIRDSLPEKSLIYFDPPYYKKGSQLYRNHYAPEDHADIAEVVCNLDIPWLVTYDNCDEIKNLYSSVETVEFSLHYSTHLSRPKATEVMFYKGLQLHEEPQLRR